MLLSVKILKGGECDIEVSDSASINMVKQIVAEQLSIPVDQQRLVFRGKTLLDSETLCDYNIVEGNKLHLFVREEEASGESTTTVEECLDFFEQLKKLLEKHFTPSDALKVLEHFRKHLTEQLHHLSLDDIERIATQHLDFNSKHSSPQTCSEENTPMQS